GRTRRIGEVEAMTFLVQVRMIYRMHAFLATPLPLDSNGIHSIFIWSGILIAILLLAFGGYGYLKRWMNPRESASGEVGFTLSDLRRLRDEGKLSAEEYEQA